MGGGGGRGGGVFSRAPLRSSVSSGPRQPHELEEPGMLSKSCCWWLNFFFFYTHTQTIYAHVYTRLYEYVDMFNSCALTVLCRGKKTNQFVLISWMTGNVCSCNIWNLCE